MFNDRHSWEGIVGLLMVLVGLILAIDGIFDVIERNLIRYSLTEVGE